MKCPNCNETLLMTERHQVEIDYCPICRGVWLDKGELDKLMSYAAEQNKVPSNTYDDRSVRPEHSNRERSDYREDYREGHRDEHNKHQQYPKKKKSFLSDFFDFD